MNAHAFSKTALSVALGSLGMPGLSYAANLGLLTSYSALNEPLRANIELSGVDKETYFGKLQGQIASAAVYAQAGLRRPDWADLAQLNFEWTDAQNVNITLRVPVPIEDSATVIILEVLVDNKIARRQYALILDPKQSIESTLTPPLPQQIPSPLPQAPITPVTKPTTTPKNNSLQSTSEKNPPSAPQKNPSNDVMPKEPRNKEPEPSGGTQKFTSEGKELIVQYGDTLSSLAMRHKPAQMNAAQWMVTVLKYNNQAFSDQNVNRLNAGRILRLPGQSTPVEFSPQEAERIINEQTVQWSRWRNKVVQNARVPGQRLEGSLSATSGAVTQGSLDNKDSKNTLKIEGAPNPIVENIAQNNAQQEAKNQTQSLEHAEKEMQRLLKMQEEQLAQKGTPTTPEEVSAQEKITKEDLLKQIEDTGSEETGVALPTPTPEQMAAEEQEAKSIFGVGFFSILAIGILGLLGSLGLLFYAQRQEKKQKSQTLLNITPPDDDTDALPSKAQEEEDEEEDEEEEQESEQVGEQTSSEAHKKALELFNTYFAFGKFQKALELMRQTLEAEPHNQELLIRALRSAHKVPAQQDFLRYFNTLSGIKNASSPLLQEAEQLRATLPPESLAEAPNEASVSTTEASPEKTTASAQEHRLPVEPQEDQSQPVTSTALLEHSSQSQPPSSVDDLFEQSAPSSTQKDTQEFNQQKQAPLQEDLSVDDLFEQEQTPLVQENTEAPHTDSLAEEQSSPMMDIDDLFEQAAIPQEDRELAPQEFPTSEEPAQESAEVVQDPIGASSSDYQTVGNDDVEDFIPPAPPVVFSPANATTLQFKVNLQEHPPTLMPATQDTSVTPSANISETPPVTPSAPEEPLYLDQAPSDMEDLMGMYDLAQAYYEMGDNEGAQELLRDIVANGNEALSNKAQALLQKVLTK